MTRATALNVARNPASATGAQVREALDFWHFEEITSDPAGRTAATIRRRALAAFAAKTA